MPGDMHRGGQRRFGSSACRAGRLAALLIACALPALAQAGTRSHPLRWVAPTDSDLAGYQVYLAFASGAYGAGVDIGFPPADGSGVAQYTLAGLDDAVDYYVVMRAYDTSRNFSVNSNEVVIPRIATPPPPPPPAPNPQVSGFVLWDHQPPTSATCFTPSGSQYAVALFDPFAGGVTLDLSQFACPCFGVEVRGNADVGSVVLAHSINGVAQLASLDSAAPLALGYAPNQPTCPASLRTLGEHVITATPCSVAVAPVGTCTGSGGVQGPTASVRFSVAASPPPPPEPPPPPPPEPATTGCEAAFATPEGMRLSWTDDPRTTMTVLWDAAFTTEGADLRFRRTGTIPWTAVDGTLLSFLDCDARYRADLRGLRPNSAYQYQVSTMGAQGPIWSTTQTFKTASPDGFNFTFFAGSGLDSVATSGHAIEIMNALRATGMRAVLGGGGWAHAQEAIDASAAVGAPEAIETWLDQASRFARTFPFMPVYGRSDVSPPESWSLYSSAHPTLQTPGAAHKSYGFDLGTVHFAALDAPTLATLDPATPEGAAHIAWLDADLNAARKRGARFLVVYMHADLLSSEAGFASPFAVRAALGPLFSRHQVALVLSGQGRSTERSLPLRWNGSWFQVGSTRVDLSYAWQGTVFLRAGVGGRTDFASWAAPTRPAWSAFRERAHSAFVRVYVSGSWLNVRVVRLEADGTRPTVMDRVSISR